MEAPSNIFRTRALDATQYGSTQKQAKVWNTFGGSLSGPIVIPNLYNGHDKTFFFIDTEENRSPGSQLVIDNVPTAAMIAGNLNGLPVPRSLIHILERHIPTTSFRLVLSPTRSTA